MLEPINKPHFSAHCAMPVEEYITERDLRNPITWGSDVEIMALSTLLQCTVHVWCDLMGGAAWAHALDIGCIWSHYSTTVPVCHTTTLTITCISIIIGVETIMTELL